ncbi:putative Multidrug resistance efflux transporter EmrE [Vibrio nigripulchritudo SOn1]|uniref:Multidrug resistance efflux transporter EmrE n=1 Tax=Vibrio nigripulchritudo SOn1 TaxID=1238450 RepID=A0AAV2VQ33_9VIBR|nr:DMT family transporter [Vibrio nigripulchritudo]CCO46543.1 putative Multidrug resistance efflux transporter EmrE [Vibrio nigripulchritudo SOn1]
MYHLFPFFTVLIWSGNAIVNKMSADIVEPSAMSFYRWLLAVLILSPFCLRYTLAKRKIILPYIPKLLVLALLGMVLNQSLGYYAAQTTSVSNMALITSLVPLISIFLSVPLLRKKVSFLSVVGAAISLFGLAFMLGQGDVLFIFQQAITEGDLLMVLAAIVYALYCVLVKKWKMPFGNLQFIYLQGVLAVAMLTPLWLSSENLTPVDEALLLIAYAGFGASVIAPWLWVKAIDVLGADMSAMFLNLLPVLAVALAAALLDETIQLFHLIGGLFVISGVMMAQFKRKPAVTTPVVD